MALLFNNHPYISSSKFSADWRATATYVGIVVDGSSLHVYKTKVPSFFPSPPLIYAAILSAHPYPQVMVCLLFNLEHTFYSMSWYVMVCLLFNLEHT